MSKINKNSLLIANQLPEFIRNDKDSFVKFLEAYYEWLDTIKLTFSYTNNYTFINGEDIIGNSSKAEAVVKSVDSTNNVLNIELITETNFKENEVISGSNSGAQATISNVSFNPSALNKHFLNLVDIDRTIDSFIDYFKNEFAVNIPKWALANKSLLYKHIKEFYLEKGNERSYKFLFHILYDKDVEFEYPDKYIFTPSENTYRRNYILRVRDVEGTFKNREIRGNSSGAKATVADVISKKIDQIKVKELILVDSTIEGEFVHGETIQTTDSEYDTAETTVFGCVNGYTITNGGNNYEVDDTISITNPSTGGTGCEMKVSSIKGGSIDNIYITNGGTGYAAGESLIFDNLTTAQGDFFKTANAEIESVDGSGTITSINIIDRGRDYVKIPSVSVNTTGGSGATFSVTGENIGKVKAVDIINQGIKYIESPTLDLSGNGDGNATVTANVGTIFIDNEGNLTNKSYSSHINKIHDGEYYQYYSYILKVDLELNKWKSVIKKLVHPAGMKVFCIYRIEDDKEVNVSLPLKKKFSFLGSGPGVGYWLYIDNNDLQTQNSIRFITDNGDVETIPSMDLNDNNYVSTQAIQVLAIDLNYGVNKNSTTTNRLYISS